MATAATPPKPPAPPPPKAPARPSPSAASPASTRAFNVSQGVTAKAQKVVVYGPGGVGKTELCSLLNEIGVKPLFLDLEEGSSHLNIERIEPTIQTWDELRAVLHNVELWRNYGAVVIDSLTKADELGVNWTVANVPHEKGHYVNSIEDYGYGKGYAHSYETFLQLLGDLDTHARAGRHVICVAHDCTAKVPNPGGDDWIRYEPRLPNANNGNIRCRVKEWCDHLLYIGFDAFAKDGKAVGSGTRTIYPTELPTHWAKSRSLSEVIPYSRGSVDLWNQLILKGE